MIAEITVALLVLWGTQLGILLALAWSHHMLRRELRRLRHADEARGTDVFGRPMLEGTWEM